MIAIVADVIVSNLVHPDVYAAVGLDPVRAKEVAASERALRRAAARPARPSSPAFLDDLGLMGGPTMRLWRRTRLVA